MNSFKRVLKENCKDARDLDINLNSLDFQFTSKPLLIGGKALEYYNVRESKNDVDFVVISFEKLMFLKVLTIKNEKSLKDLYLMRDRMAVINTIRQDFY